MAEKYLLSAICYFVYRKGVKYCDEYVCVSARITRKPTWPNFTNFLVHVVEIFHIHCVGLCDGPVCCLLSCDGVGHGLTSFVCGKMASHQLN